MYKLLGIGLRVVLYLFIGLPILRGIFSGLGRFAIIPALIILIFIVSIVEARKLMNRLVDFLAGQLGVADAVSTGDSGIIDALGPKSYVECKSCGFSVELRGNKGKCRACGTVVG